MKEREIEIESGRTLKIVDDGHEAHLVKALTKIAESKRCHNQKTAGSIESEAGEHSAECTPAKLSGMVKGHLFLTQESMRFILDLKKEIRKLSNTNPLTIGAFLFYFGASFLALCIFHIFFR